MGSQYRQAHVVSHRKVAFAVILLLLFIVVNVAPADLFIQRQWQQTRVIIVFALDEHL